MGGRFCPPFTSGTPNVFHLPASLGMVVRHSHKNKVTRYKKYCIFFKLARYTGSDWVPKKDSANFENDAFLWFAYQWCRKVKNIGGATSKGWAESAPHGWNRVNWSAKYWGGQWPPWPPRFRHHWFCTYLDLLFDKLLWLRQLETIKWFKITQYFYDLYLIACRHMQMIVLPMRWWSLYLYNWMKMQIKKCFSICSVAPSYNRIWEWQNYNLIWFINYFIFDVISRKNEEIFMELVKSYNGKKEMSST